jgi:murein DD-endopeptidase MepM/ murein hydrolase activator NlpD
MRRIVTVLLLSTLLVASSPPAAARLAGAPHDPPAPPARSDSPVRYVAPVQPLDVVRGFDPPAGPYAAGHRGVDLAVTPGQAVGAAALGTVTFAGAVAGRGVVVLAHADGVSTEYEPVDPAVTAGQQVHAGEVLGTVSGAHEGCVPDRCLHWGARRGGAYFDPLTLLEALGPVRLLPW